MTRSNYFGEKSLICTITERRERGRERGEKKTPAMSSI